MPGSALAPSERHPLMAHPVQVLDLPAQTLVPYTPAPSPAPTVGRTTCAVHKESRDDTSALKLRCGLDDSDPGGGMIDSITFADFGKPTGGTRALFTPLYAPSLVGSHHTSAHADR